MVAGLFAWLVLALWRRSFFTALELPLYLPAQKAAALAGVIAALAYVALAGFGVPAQRTLLMLMVVALALWSGRITGVSHVLCAALGVVLIFDPWAVLWPGFWLSFGAVGVIVYATSGRTRSKGPPRETPARIAAWRAALAAAGLSQYAVTLGLVPLSLLLFSQISLVSPLANAIAIPLVSFIVTPLALMGSILPQPLSGALLGAGHWLIEMLAGFLAWLGGFPASVWTAAQPSWPLFLLALAGTLWLLAPRGWPARWLGAVAWLPLLANPAAAPEAPQQLWVTAFDVGQGMALLLETAHFRLLYDTGPAYSPESDAGSRVILPYLKARGINRLDMLVVSHSDTDHAGGAVSILREVETGLLSSSLAPDSAIVRAAVRHRPCQAGQRWQWDGVTFEMLYPDEQAYADPWRKPNGRSCTLKVSTPTQAILLPGDIEAAQEASLLAGRPQQLKASVLLAPHHGSGTSSTPAFLQAVAPHMALFQVGYRNRYHHPKAEVFARYGALGILRLRSDDSGAISLRLGEAQALAYSEHRKDHARYWYGR